VTAATPKTSGREVAWTEYELHLAEAALAEGKKIFHVTAQVDPLCAMPIAARQLIANALEPLAQVLGTRPEVGTGAQVKVLDLLLATTRSQSEITAKCQIPTVIARAECFELQAATARNNGSTTTHSEQPGPSEREHEPGPAESPTAGAQAKHTIDNVLRVDA